jgi:hypothetical protein
MAAKRIRLGYAFTPKDRGKNPFLSRIIDTPDARATYASVLRSFEQFKPYFNHIAISGNKHEETPYWLNGWIPGLDALSLYGLAATRNPSIYIEVGSGNSTKFVRQSIRDHNLKTKVVSIDPQPRANIDRLCDTIHRVRCEDLDLAIFADLPSDAVLFVDNSHRAFQNSDVTVFFTEILPALPAGVIWGVHDIFLPYDYIPDWHKRYYNEQYLLASYLLGGARRDEILLANWFITHDHELSNIVHGIFDHPYCRPIKKGGTCFWCNRT